jgi:hypothetical protein
VRLIDDLDRHDSDVDDQPDGYRVS